MSCKSALYVVNNTSETITAGSAIPMGAVIRRYGSNANLNGSAIALLGQGYYDIDVSVTLAPTAAGAVTVSLYKDGTAIPGATATGTAAAAGDSVNLSFPAMVRLGCCDTGASLTLVCSAAATTSNVAVTVEKI